MKKLLRRPLGWALALLLTVALAAGLCWFQPWKLIVDTEVREALPQADAAPTPDAGNQLLAAGTFITHEHETTGEVRVVRLADGRRQLLIADLSTSNGPDLRVWLSDQPVRPGVAGWRVFDDGEWVELGKLKGNRGDQIYPIPPSVDLDELPSVSIWCRRFSVSFGAAALTPRGAG
ncbi:DM13 domain-containing protein [Pilimelia columellifera]|uniref:DM13 domain-containing protein n=1 Tax=Pilimelia columellifera subsp. columellifera TaxID=706583 RepID=A0ABN3NP78_9ACTN